METEKACFEDTTGRKAKKKKWLLVGKRNVEDPEKTRILGVRVRKTAKGQPTVRSGRDLPKKCPSLLHKWDDNNSDLLTIQFVVVALTWKGKRQC